MNSQPLRIPKLARSTVMVDPRVIAITPEAIKTFIDKKNIDNHGIQLVVSMSLYKIDKVEVLHPVNFNVEDDDDF